MTRLRTVSPSAPGLRRKRRGRGFTYVDRKGATVTDPVVLQRIKDLVIPPAWEDVWICEPANGHIQAVGTDVAGRRQYLYHPAWREQRDKDKHDRILVVARRLPKARDRVEQGPEAGRHAAGAGAGDGVPVAGPRASSGSGRELPRGQRQLRLGHVAARARRASRRASWSSPTPPSQARSAADHVVRQGLPLTRSALCCERRGAGRSCWPRRTAGAGSTSRARTSTATSRRSSAATCSAKDFRTWHATVLAAVVLAEASDGTGAGSTKAARKRSGHGGPWPRSSDYLGNTPTIARKSYVDPRVIDLFEDGYDDRATLVRLVIGAVGRRRPRRHDEPPKTHGAIERAVLRMLREAPKARRPSRRS